MYVQFSLERFQYFFYLFQEVLGSEEKKEFLKQISRAICERFLEKASKVSFTNGSSSPDQSMN